MLLYIYLKYTNVMIQRYTKYDTLQTIFNDRHWKQIFYLVLTLFIWFINWRKIYDKFDPEFYKQDINVKFGYMYIIWSIFAVIRILIITFTDDAQIVNLILMSSNKCFRVSNKVHVKKSNKRLKKEQ